MDKLTVKLLDRIKREIEVSAKRATDYRKRGQYDSSNDADIRTMTLLDVVNMACEINDEELAEMLKEAIKKDDV